MAYQGLHDFVDNIKREYKEAESRNRSQEQYAYLNALMYYYEALKKHAKFSSQREYAKQAMKELCPPFYRGYFENGKISK